MNSFLCKNERAIALPRGHMAELPVIPPFTLHRHLSRSYSSKLLRNTYINFLYTTVYFSDISNVSLCIPLQNMGSSFFFSKYACNSYPYESVFKVMTRQHRLSSCAECTWGGVISVCPCVPPLICLIFEDCVTVLH
jgi:hypothetical protein